MKKIAGIAWLTIRNAIHSRLFAVGVAVLTVIILGLPGIMQGDSSPASLLFIFVNYTFGLLMFVLALLAAWSGAGAISLEIAGRQMQLLMVKPLRPVEIWAGKLLGLTAINLALLVLGGTLLYAVLQWSLNSARINPENRLDLRRGIMTVYRPVPELPAAGRQSAPVAVDPGRSLRRCFEPAPREKTDSLLLKFRFVPAPFSYQSPVAGTWRAFAGTNACFFTNAAAASPHMTISLLIPNPPGRGPDRLELEYANQQTNPPVTVFFPAQTDLSLFAPESSFEANLFRGLIMVFARLCFFTALGMFAGTLFSFPVAVFASMGLMAVAFAGGLARQLAERGFLPSSAGKDVSAWLAGLNEIVRGVFRFFGAVLPPLDRFDPLAFLPDNLFISWRLAGEALVVLGLYALILAMAGALCLSRKEIARPS